jgi:hypothetical protein
MAVTLVLRGCITIRHEMTERPNTGAVLCHTLVRMGKTSRDLRARVIRALAKVGLVWAVAVLGALFMATASQGQHLDGGHALSSASAHAQQTLAVTPDDAPRPAGLVLALVVLAGGATVLAAGAFRGARTAEPSATDDPEPALHLSLPLDLDLLAA